MRWYFWMAYNKNCHFWNCLCPQAPILPLAISLYFSCKNQHFVNSWIKLIKSQEKHPIFSYLYNKNVCYMYLGKCFFKNFCIIWKLKHYLMISSARQWICKKERNIISLQKWEIWFHCCLPIIISLVLWLHTILRIIVIFLWFCHIFHTVYIGGVQKMHSNFRITKNETTTILLLRRKETASSLLIAKIHKIVISNQNLIRIQLECV